MALAQVCALAGSAAFATTLVRLAGVWHLDAAHAGMIGSAYFVGYTVGVPLLVALTDRHDARMVYAAGCAIGGLAGAGFALFAHGFWSALLFQALAGFATGGTYMPGLRMLTARLSGELRIRVVPYYTTGWSVGTSLSFLLCGWIAAYHDWHGAYFAGSAGCLLAAVCAAVAVAGIPVLAQTEKVAQRHPLDFRPVLHNRRALALVLAYGGHCWELFAFRSWLPTYLLFAWSRFHQRAAGVIVSRWSMLIVLVGVPASILGAESANSHRRNRTIRYFEWASIVLCLASVGLSKMSFGLALAALFVYSVAIMADSGALTASTIAVASPGEQGATLAIYSLVGFAGAAVGPLVVGRVLDYGGGFRTHAAWVLGFIAMGIGSALASVAMTKAMQLEKQEKPENL
ncbi:MAG: MFS transporter [Acidobacteriota bacterium]|nr:MFS transporter [Acidobacteriota bacterium]